MVAILLDYQVLKIKKGENVRTTLIKKKKMKEKKRWFKGIRKKKKSIVQYFC